MFDRFHVIIYLLHSSIRSIFKRVGRIQEENQILQLYYKRFQCTKAPVHKLDHIKYSVDVAEARPTPAPTAEELRILLEKRNPRRLIVGK